jgi:hypothetical protein
MNRGYPGLLWFRVCSSDQKKTDLRQKSSTSRPDSKRPNTRGSCFADHAFRSGVRFLMKTVIARAGAQATWTGFADPD